MLGVWMDPVTAHVMMTLRVALTSGRVASARAPDEAPLGSRPSIGGAPVCRARRCSRSSRRRDPDGGPVRVDPGRDRCQETVGRPLIHRIPRSVASGAGHCLRSRHDPACRRPLGHGRCSRHCDRRPSGARHRRPCTYRAPWVRHATGWCHSSWNPVGQPRPGPRRTLVSGPRAYHARDGSGVPGRHEFPSPADRSTR